MLLLNQSMTVKKSLKTFKVTLQYFKILTFHQNLSILVKIGKKIPINLKLICKDRLPVHSNAIIIRTINNWQNNWFHQLNWSQLRNFQKTQNTFQSGDESIKKQGLNHPRGLKVSGLFYPPKTSYSGRSFIQLIRHL